MNCPQFFHKNLALKGSKHFIAQQKVASKIPLLRVCGNPFRFRKMAVRFGSVAAPGPRAPGAFMLHMQTMLWPTNSTYL